MGSRRRRRSLLILVLRFGVVRCRFGMGVVGFSFCLVVLGFGIVVRMWRLELSVDFLGVGRLGNWEVFCEGLESEREGRWGDEGDELKMPFWFWINGRVYRPFLK